MSTTVDEALLDRARALHGAAYDRAYRIDGEANPATEPDAWGDLATWRERAGTP